MTTPPSPLQKEIQRVAEKCFDELYHRGLNELNREHCKVIIEKALTELSTLEVQNKVLTDNLKSKILSCLPPGISMQDHSNFSQKVDCILKIHHSARTTER